MSAFAEPLAQARKALSTLLHIGAGHTKVWSRAEQQKRAKEALAALDLIEERAKELEAERDRYAETIRWFWAKLAPGQTYADLEGETLYGLLERVLAERDAAEQRATEMEKALRRQAEREEENESRSRALGDHSGSVIHGYCATQLRFLIAALSAREEAQ